MDSILKYISKDCNVILNTKIEKIKRKKINGNFMIKIKNLTEYMIGLY